MDKEKQLTDKDKQLADKERVAAALENSHLLGIVNKASPTSSGNHFLAFWPAFTLLVAKKESGVVDIMVVRSISLIGLTFSSYLARKLFHVAETVRGATGNFELSCLKKPLKNPPFLSALTQVKKMFLLSTKVSSFLL